MHISSCSPSGMVPSGGRIARRRGPHPAALRRARCPAWACSPGVRLIEIELIGNYSRFPTSTPLFVCLSLALFRVAGIRVTGAFHAPISRVHWAWLVKRFFAAVKWMPLSDQLMRLFSFCALSIPTALCRLTFGSKQFKRRMFNAPEIPIYFITHSEL